MFLKEHVDILKNTLKSFAYFKSNQKSVWSKLFWYVKVYILKVYAIHYKLR